MLQEMLQDCVLPRLAVTPHEVRTLKDAATLTDITPGHVGFPLVKEVSPEARLNIDG